MAEPKTYTLEYLPGTPLAEIEAHKPDPFPGTVEALAQGCTCPLEQPWPKGLKVGSDCPVQSHQFTLAMKN